MKDGAAAVPVPPVVAVDQKALWARREQLECGGLQALWAPQESVERQALQEQPALQERRGRRELREQLHHFYKESVLPIKTRFF